MEESRFRQFEIQDFVRELASKKRISRFYPQTLSRSLQIPLELVIVELERMVDSGYLLLQYEIRCSYDGSTLVEVDDYVPYLNKEFECTDCGDCDSNPIISYANVYPVYIFTEEYKQYIKKN